MGTPEFARIILERLHDEHFNIKAVFAQPDKPAGRGKKMQTPPVALFAKEKNLCLFQPNKIKKTGVLEQIKQIKPDFIIVAAYGKILPQSLLDAARVDAINVHGSVLPAYRGAAPINYALMKGDDETGVTIMRMVKEMDAGPIYHIKKIPIEKSDDAISLTIKLAHLGAEALVEAIDLIKDQGLKPKDQDLQQVTYAPKLTKDDSIIKWSNSSIEIFNLIRAIVPWPVASTFLFKKTLKVFKSEVLDNKSKAKPGTIVHIAKSGLTVTTGSTDLLIKEVQLEGKKRMNAFDLANGLRLKTGEGCI